MAEHSPPIRCRLLHRDVMTIKVSHPNPEPGITAARHVAYECCRCGASWGTLTCPYCPTHDPRP